MKSNFTKLLAAGALMASSGLSAQTTVSTFEEVTIPDTFLSYSRSIPVPDDSVIYSFTSGNVSFTGIKFNWGGGATGYTGFDCSRSTDSVTNSFTNESAIAGSGYEGSENYALPFLNAIFPEDPTNTHPLGFKITDSSEVKGAYFTNATYTYKYLQENLSSETFLKLTVRGYQSGSMVADSVVIDLARVSATDTTILRDWTYVSLEALGIVDSVTFQLESNDAYCPFYFAMDNLTLYKEPVSTDDITNHITFDIAPNPVSGSLNILVPQPEKYRFEIMNINGSVLKSGSLTPGIDVSSLQSGMYLIRIINPDQKEGIKKFIKK